MKEFQSFKPPKHSHHPHYNKYQPKLKQLMTNLCSHCGLPLGKHHCINLRCPEPGLEHITAPKDINPYPFTIKS
jgi:hypothetical protein